MAKTILYRKNNEDEEQKSTRQILYRHDEEEEAQPQRYPFYFEYTQPTSARSPYTYKTNEARRILAKHGHATYSDEDQREIDTWNQMLRDSQDWYNNASWQLGKNTWADWQGDAAYSAELSRKLADARRYMYGLADDSVIRDNVQSYLSWLEELQKGYQSRADYFGQFAGEQDYKNAQDWNSFLRNDWKSMHNAYTQLGKTGYEDYAADDQYMGEIPQKVQRARAYLGTLTPGTERYNEVQSYLDYLQQMYGAYQDRADFYGQFPNEDAYNAFTGLQAEYANAAENGESYDDIYRRLQAQADQERTGNRSEIDQLEARADELDQMLMNGVKTVETPQGLVNVPLTAEETQQLQQEVLQIRQERDRLKAGGYESNYAAQWARTLRYADLPARQDFLSGAEAGRAAYEADEADELARLNRWHGGRSGGPTSLSEYNYGDGGSVSSYAYGMAKSDRERYAPSDLWSEQERSTFYWLWQNRGREAAVEYGEDLNISHNSQAQAEQGREHAAWAEEHPGATFAMNIAAAPWQMAEFLDKTQQVLAHDRYVPHTEMGRGTAASTMMTAVAQKLNEKGTLPEWLPAIGGKGLGDAYQLANSIAKSMATARLGGGATNLLFFGEAANSGFDEAKARGASDDQALIMGALNGAAEVIGETVSIERLVRMKNPAGVKRWLVEAMKQGGVEASEEVFTTLLNTVSDAVVMGDKSQLQTSIREKMAAGMSREQAEKDAWQEWFNDIAYDAVGGFLSGGVSGLLQQGGQILRASTREYSGADADRLVELALQEPEGSKARALAEKIQKQGTMSQQEAARLRELMPNQSAALDQELRRQTEQEVRERLSQEGIQVRASDVRAITEELLGGEEQSYSDATVQRVAQEMKREHTLVENVRYQAAQRDRQRQQTAGKLSEQLTKAFTASKLEISDRDMELLQDGYVPGAGSVNSYVLGVRDAYRLGRSGMSLEQAQKESGSKIHEVQFRHAWQLGYQAGGGKLDQSGNALEKETADISTEEGKQRVLSALSMLGSHAETAAAVYQETQDVEAFAADMNKAAALYAAAGADVASVSRNVGLLGLTADQMKAAQEIGSQIRQERQAAVKTAQARMVELRQKAAAAKKAGQNSREIAELEKAINEASAYGREQQKLYRQQLDALEQMAKENPEAAKTESFQKALAEANRTLDSLQTLQKTVKELQQKKREMEGRKVIKRKRGTVSFGGGKINGKEVAAVDPSKLSRTQKRIVAMVSAIADAVNLDYVFFQGEENVGGAYEQGGVIYINLNAGGADRTIAAATLAHEMTHFLQEYAPEEYRQLRDFVVDTILQKSPAEFERLMQQQAKWEPGKSWDYLENELVANACQEMLLNEKVINQLARENMRLAEKILDVLEKLRDKIHKAFEGVNFDRTDAPFAAARAVRDSVDEIAELWAKALHAATESYNAEQTLDKEKTAPEGGVQYMAWDRKDINRAFIDYNNTDSRSRAQTSKLQSLKDRGKTVAISQEVINQLPGGVDWSDLKKAREAIKDILKHELGSDSVYFTHDGGTLTAYLTASGRDHSAGGNANEQRAAIYSLIKELIKNSEYIYSAKNDIHSMKGLSLPADTEWDSFEAVAEINEKYIPVIFSVFTNAQDIRSKIYAIFADENGAVSRGTGLQKQVGQPSYGATTPKLSIADQKDKSKPESEKSATPEAQSQRWEDTADDTPEEARGRDVAAARLQAENAELKKSIQDLQALSKTQKGSIEKLQKMMKLTRTPETRLADAKRMARQLQADYAGRLDNDALAAELKSLGDYLLQTDTDKLSEEELKDRATAIAAEIVDTAKEQVTDSATDFMEIAGRIKGAKVSIEERYTQEIGDFEIFRKSLFGKLTVAKRENNSRENRDGYTTVDQLYSELQEDYGKGFFPEVLNEGEQLQILSRLLDMSSPMEVNPFEQHRAEATEEIANRILRETMEGTLRPVEPSFADKAKSRQDALRQQILSLKRENALSEKEAGRLYQTVYDLTMTLDKAESRQKSLAETARYRQAQLREEGRTRAAEVKARERARSEKQITALKEHYQEMAERYRERRNESAGAAKYRKQVEQRAGQLYEMLMTNSDKLHVPEVLKAPLGEFLETLDFTSKRALKGGKETKKDRAFGARLLELGQILENQQRYIDGDGTVQQDLGGYLDISADSLQFLRDSAEMITQAMREAQGFTINQMSAQQLKDLAMFLQNLRAAINNMNNFMANERYASVREAADADIAGMEELGRAGELAENRMLNEFLWKNGTPYYIFRRFGEGGESIFLGFAKGWGVMAFDAREIIDFTESVYTDKEVKAWKKETHEISLEDGSTIRMTTAQIMELSQLLGREQARKHILKGGIRIGNIETKKGGKGDTTHYHLTDADIQQILGELTDRQMAVAKELQRFMAEKGAEWGNEVSMKRFGYKFYEEGPGYYPIRTDNLDRPMADTDAQQNSMFRLLNLSSSKSLNPRASNALIVGDIFETFSDHMGDMAKLHGMGLPVLDAIKWFNFKERIDRDDGTYDTRTLQGAMEQAFGSAAGSYFRTLMKDINGVTENGDRGAELWSRAIGRFKAAAVGANLRVALLQPTAYVRASTVLKPKYMAAAFGDLKASMFTAAGAKAAWKEAMQHSGEMVWKDIGGYDTDLARTMRGQIQHDDSFLDKLVELSMIGAEWGDKLTWGRLWAACKLQAKGENKSLTGEKLMEATEDLFREVIYSSQVMDSTLTRSELMRARTIGSKMVTPFMAEPTVSINILMDAASQLHNDTRRYGRAEAWARNSKKIGKAFAVYASSAAAAALAESLWDAVRDDDDEEYWKKFLQALFGEDNAARIWGDELAEDAKGVIGSAFEGNLWQDMMVLGKLPVLKDVISLLSGYQSTNMATDAYRNIINAYQIWRETIDLRNGVLEKPTKVTYYGKMTKWGKIYKSLQGLSQLTGLPVYGLTRDAVAIWNTVMNGRKDDWKLRTYDANQLSGSKLNKFEELVQSTGVSQKDYQRMLQEINADGNSSISQAEAGPYLLAEERAGRLSHQQAAAIWAACTTGKASYDEWIEKQK